MKTHTPGPWLVNFEQNKFDSRRSKVQVVDGSSASLNNGGLPLVLANVNAMPFNDESVPLANAHLIASAPDLLSALEFVSGILSQPVFRNDSIDSASSSIMRNDVKVALHHIANTIAKAKGQL
jgi:hypothetical protein